MTARYIKKFILYLMVLVLTVSVCLGTAYAASVNDFTDVDSDDWFYEPVSYVVEKGLYNGISSTSFSPNSSMTRGMFITVLGRYAGVDPDDWLAGTINANGVNFRKGPGTGYASIRMLYKNAALTITGKEGDWYSVTVGSEQGYVYADFVSPKYHVFNDVSYDQYYAGYAVWAYEKGYISGDGNAYTFSPNVAITREQICKILNSYASVNGCTLTETADKISFTDADKISSWASDAVNRLQRSGIINGISDGNGGYSFEPSRGATRAEVAKMICGFVEVTGKAPSGSPSGGSDTDDSGSQDEDQDDSGNSTTATPSPTPSTAPSTSVDAAPIVSATLSTDYQRVRAAVYMSTNTHSTQVSSVTLENISGGGFEYGYIDTNRNFISEGSLSAASLTVTTDGSEFTVKDSGGSTVLSKSATFALRASGAEDTLTRVNGGLRYYGDFEFQNAYNASGKITLINVVDMDDYIKGVIPYEISTSWPAETLKAVAVATRSYTLSYCETSVYRSKYGFDIPANDGTQTYKGRDESRAESYFQATDAAVDATANMYLTYNGAVCNCTYFSSSGGATESCENVWGGKLAYLTGKVDPYEAAASSQISGYTSTVTHSRTGSTMNALAAKLGLGTIAADGIKVNTYDSTGNVKSVVITDINGNSCTLDQWSSFGRLSFLTNVGISYTSYRYSVSYNSSADSFTITRYGWGHNVGMSQWGAYAMAKYYNMNFQDILGFYYTGTEIRYGA